MTYSIIATLLVAILTSGTYAQHGWRVAAYAAFILFAFFALGFFAGMGAQ